MLSAKALVNVVLLTIVVPRIIKRSVSTKTIHGSEVRLNYIGAEVSIAISVIGVLCVALAFRFWMLLIGMFTLPTLTVWSITTVPSRDRLRDII
jgi:hypothetical protein